MFAPAGMGYDRAITIFSPDGKLYQVEYAFEAVKRGWTTLGVRSNSAVVLAVEKKQIMPLLDLTSIEKIFKVDDHICMTFAGFAADGRILIDYARLRALQHRLLYDEPIDVEALTKRVCDVIQSYTQHAGVRPFGVALLIAGVDGCGTHLFMTEPSGQYMSYYAIAIGSGAQAANEYLEKHYRKDMSTEETILLALKALSMVMEGKIKPELVDIGVIDAKDKVFKKLTIEEVGKYISKITG